MIHASQLTRSYQHGRSCIDAISNVSFEMQPGEKIAIVGRSGSGKSTLLNLLSGLDRPTAGTLTVDEKRLDQLSRTEMAEYRLRTTGFVFQAFQLIPQRTAFQNIELPLILSGVSPRKRRQDVEQWLAKVGLLSRRDHLPYQLSGGEQQRVAIARALVNQPKVILADEPTGNLDSVTAAEIMKLLMSLCGASGATSVIVTHDPEVAKKCSERLFQMQDGSLTEVTELTEVPSNGDV